MQNMVLQCSKAWEGAIGHQTAKMTFNHIRVECSRPKARKHSKTSKKGQYGLWQRIGGGGHGIRPDLRDWHGGFGSLSWKRRKLEPPQSEMIQKEKTHHFKTNNPCWHQSKHYCEGLESKSFLRQKLHAKKWWRASKNENQNFKKRICFQPKFSNPKLSRYWYSAYHKLSNDMRHGQIRRLVCVEVGFQKNRFANFERWCQKTELRKKGGVFGLFFAPWNEIIEHTAKLIPNNRYIRYRDTVNIHIHINNRNGFDDGAACSCISAPAHRRRSFLVRLRADTPPEPCRSAVAAVGGSGGRLRSRAVMVENSTSQTKIRILGSTGSKFLVVSNFCK